MAKTKNLDKTMTIDTPFRETKKETFGIDAGEDTTMLGSFQKGKVSRIVVVAKMWQDKLYMDFRQFHMNDDGIYMPTKKGFMIPYNQIGDFFTMINDISKV